MEPEDIRELAETAVAWIPERAPVSAFAEVLDHAIGAENFETLSASVAILSRLLRSGEACLNNADRIAISKAFRLDSGIEDSGQDESDRPPSKAFRLDH